MRGNFELKLQNSPKLPRKHAQDFIVMQISKDEKGYSTGKRLLHVFVWYMLRSLIREPK